jgi:hypothetical protein
MKKFKTIIIFLFCFGILCCSLVNFDSKQNAEQIIASTSVVPIIGLDKSALRLPYIQEFIEYYFYSRCGVRPTLLDLSTALEKKGPKIILCTKETANLYSIKLPAKEIQYDGFHLFSKLDKHGTPTIFCVGNNVNGIKYAIYRLIYELSYHQPVLSLRHPIELSITPFFENRLAMQVLSLKLDDNEANSKFFFNEWSENKVAAMVHLFDFFGFNGVETNFGSTPGHAIDETTQKLQVKLFDEQRRIGGKALAFIWGAAFMENEKIKEVCLNNEEGGEKMLQIYQDEAKVIGSHIDAFISHWADPGGDDTCNCTIRIPQFYHLELMKSMQVYNPKIESFFSLWCFHPNVISVRQERRFWSFMWHWTDTKVIEDVLDAGILPASVGIWVGDPNGYNPDYCRAIINKGRTLGIWTWYLADNEIRQGLHVHWKQVSEYFRNQSKEDFAKQIKWHQIENNRHGDWASINMAVGGAMMIDPQDDAEKYAREFCASIVGDSNADILLDVLDAVAQTRCLYHRNLGGLRFHDHEGWGSSDPEEDIRRIQKALENLDKVTLEKNFMPKIPYMELVFDPEVMLSDLKKTLQNILLHNKARSKLLAAITNEEYHSLPWADKQERIKKLSKELAPVFDFKGIGTCPEAQVWDRLMQTGLLPELPHRLKHTELIPELPH